MRHVSNLLKSELNVQFLVPFDLSQKLLNFHLSYFELLGLISQLKFFKNKNLRVLVQ